MQHSRPRRNAMTIASESMASGYRRFASTASRPRDVVAMPDIRPGEPQPDAVAPVTIVLIDDHAIVRQGLRSLLEREIDLRVVGEARSPGEALVLVERTPPTIVLLDMKLTPAS